MSARKCLSCLGFWLLRISKNKTRCACIDERKNDLHQVPVADWNAHRTRFGPSGRP